MNPKFTVKQRITPLANQYRVYDAEEHLIAFAQQKRLAFREKVNFFTDESKTQTAFTFRAEKVMDIHGQFIVEDAEGKEIGRFKKEFKRSLLSSTWSILKDGQAKITVTESNIVLAVIRRFVGFIPIVGGIIDLVTAFFRYHFVFIDTASNKEIGIYKKTKLFFDHYELSMEDAAYKKEDWRVLAALAVALDALQGR